MSGLADECHLRRPKRVIMQEIGHHLRTVQFLEKLVGIILRSSSHLDSACRKSALFQIVISFTQSRLVLLWVEQDAVLGSKAL